LALERRAELGHVPLAHPREPVEPLGAPRCGRGEARGGDQAYVFEGRRAGERVRRAARGAPGREAPAAERVDDRLDVSGRVGDLPSGMARRATVARTVIADEPDAAALRVLDPRLV